MPLGGKKSDSLDVHEIVLNAGLAVIGEVFPRGDAIEVFEGVGSAVAIFVVNVVVWRD